jgi:hypothetical protein
MTFRLLYLLFCQVRQAPPLEPSKPVVLAPLGRVVRRDRLGGLIHEYAQVA